MPNLKNRSQSGGLFISQRSIVPIELSRHGNCRSGPIWAEKKRCILGQIFDEFYDHQNTLTIFDPLKKTLNFSNVFWSSDFAKTGFEFDLKLSAKVRKRIKPSFGCTIQISQKCHRKLFPLLGLRFEIGLFYFFGRFVGNET